MRYKSKIGLGILFTIVGTFSLVSVLLLLEGAYEVLLAFVPVFLFIYYIYTQTYYEIVGNELIVKSGFLLNLVIPIANIKSIGESRNPLSAPALSLDRLAIKYDKRGYVLVSPKQKKEFIAHLLTINSKIEVTYSKKKI